MVGTVKKLVDRIIEERSKGNPTLMMTTKTKLMIKGLRPDDYTASTPDDPELIKRVHAIAQDMGVTLTGARC